MHKHLRIEVKPSRMMLGYLAALHLLCLLVLLNMVLAIGLLCVSLAILLLGVSFAYHCFNYYSLAGRHCVREIRLADEYCVLCCADGYNIKADLAERHYVSSWLVVVDLKLRATGAKKQLVLFPDAITAEQLRRLRVRLRFPVSSPAYNCPG